MMKKIFNYCVKKIVAFACITAIALAAVQTAGVGTYSRVIDAEAADAVYVVENLKNELGVSKSLNKLNASGTSDDDLIKATKGFLDKYDRSIIFDQETNKFYYASGSKSASSTNTFRTAGYELTFKIGSDTYKVDVLRIPNSSKNPESIISGRYDLKIVAEAKSDGMTYNLFCVSMDALDTIFANRDLDFSALFYSSRSTLTMTGNAYLVKCVNGTQKAWLNADAKGKATEGGTSSALAHTASEAKGFNMGITTENYFNKIMKLKPNAYNVYTNKVTLANGSTSGAYYPSMNSSNLYYYINGNRSEAVYNVKFTGTSKKSTAAAETDEENDFDLLYGGLDVTTKEELAVINENLNPAPDENGVAATLLQAGKDFGDGTFKVIAEKESNKNYDSSTEIKNKGGTYTSNASLLSSTQSYSIRPYITDTYTSKLEIRAGFKVNNLEHGSITAITPFAKAVKNSAQPDKSGIMSDRYDQTNVLYLIADKEAPKRAEDVVEVVVEDNIRYCRFKIKDSGSGIKSAVYSNTSLAIRNGNNTTNGYGITRDTSAYVYIDTSTVSVGQEIAVTLKDNVGNEATVSVTIPGNGLRYWDRGVNVYNEFEITSNPTSAFLIANGYARKYYTFNGWKFMDGSFIGNVVQPGATMNCSGISNLNAQWSANTYTIVFHSNAPTACSTKDLGLINGQSGFDRDIEKTAQFTGNGSVSCDVSLPGYEFQGWFSNAECTVNSFGNEMDYSADGIECGIEPDEQGKIHLYAKWEPVYVSIVFDLNKPENGVNHTVTSSSNPSFIAGSDYIIAKFDSTITGVPTAQLTGWHDAKTDATTLVSWFSNSQRSAPGNCLSEGSKLDYALIGNPDTYGRIITFYAQWDPNTYTIQYESNPPDNASTTDSSIWGWSQTVQTITYDVPAYLQALDLNTPSIGENTDVLPGYTWLYWQTDNGTTYTNQDYIVNLTPHNHEIITLYAQWQPNIYTIYYHANKPTKENNTHEASASPVIRYKNLMSTDKIVVTMVWDGQFYTKVPTVSLTGWHARYDAAGVIDAWYSEKNYTNPGNRVSNDGTFNYKTVGYPGNKNYYAQWQANWYYVCYNANGQDSVIKGNIQNEKSMSTQVEERERYMTEHAYTDTFEKCVQSSMRNSRNTRIHIYDLEENIAGSRFIRYDEGVADKQEEHFTNNEKEQQPEYSTGEYDKYGLPDVAVSYLKRNTTWKTKYDYDFLGWDIEIAHKDDGTRQCKYNEGAVIENLTTTHRGRVAMYAFWNAFPNYDSVKDTAHFSVYEGADITMQMLKEKVQIWDKEEECISDKVVIEEIVYIDGSKVTNPKADYLLDTGADKIGEYQVTFSVTDNRGDKTYFTTLGRIEFNNEPVLADLEGRYFYLENIKELTTEQEYELLMRGVVRTDVEDDAYKMQEFLQKDDLFLGRVESYIGFGQNEWYQGILTRNEVWEFPVLERQKGLELLQKDMKTLTQLEGDTGKTFSYVCYTNDSFKKQSNKKGDITIVDTANDDSIPENTTRKRVRFISNDYLDTLPEDWQDNEKREKLEESLKKFGAE